MEKRKILFTAADKSVIRVYVELPGIILNPPKFVQFREKLYEYKGSGMGGEITTNFYHEVVGFMVVETEKDYSRQEFNQLTPA